MIPLSYLQEGQSAVVRTVGGEPSLRRRLLEMGLLPGTVLTVQKRAPFGDPLQLSLRHFSLTVRASDASHIQVERKSEK